MNDDPLLVESESRFSYEFILNDGVRVVVLGAQLTIEPDESTFELPHRFAA